MGIKATHQVSPKAIISVFSLGSEISTEIEKHTLLDWTHTDHHQYCKNRVILPKKGRKKGKKNVCQLLALF